MYHNFIIYSPNLTDSSHAMFLVGLKSKMNRDPPLPSLTLAHFTVCAMILLPAAYCNRLLVVDLGSDEGGGDGGADLPSLLGPPEELPQRRTKQGAAEYRPLSEFVKT